MTSNHDLLGMLRGTRKRLRRRRGQFYLLPSSDQDGWLKESDRLWRRFYDLLVVCIDRGVVHKEYDYWFTREHVISDNWGCRP